jgi:hypothetical protein
LERLEYRGDVDENVRAKNNQKRRSGRSQEGKDLEKGDENENTLWGSASAHNFERESDLETVASKILAAKKQAQKMVPT